MKSLIARPLRGGCVVRPRPRTIIVQRQAGGLVELALAPPTPGPDEDADEDQEADYGDRHSQGVDRIHWLAPTDCSSAPFPAPEGMRSTRPARFFLRPRPFPERSRRPHRARRRSAARASWPLDQSRP